MQCEQAAFAMHASACLMPQIGRLRGICGKVGFEPTLTTVYCSTFKVQKNIKYNFCVQRHYLVPGCGPLSSL